MNESLGVIKYRHRLIFVYYGIEGKKLLHFYRFTPRIPKDYLTTYKDSKGLTEDLQNFRR